MHWVYPSRFLQYQMYPSGHQRRNSEQLVPRRVPIKFSSQMHPYRAIAPPTLTRMGEITCPGLVDRVEIANLDRLFI